jgi:SH3 domain-containing protein
MIGLLSSFGRSSRSLVLGLLCAVGLGWSAPASAQPPEDVETVARVTTSTSDLRAGPGLSYRVIHRAERGEIFAVQGREPTGFWLRVYLNDGRTAYLLGDTVDTVALDAGDERAPGGGVFSPPPLETAHAGLAMTAGVFDGNGYAEIKPAIVLNRSLSLEPYVGIALGSAGRSLLYGAGAAINLAPDWALAPYLALGGGGFTTLPNDDAFALEKETVFHARAGGGFLLSLRWRLILRVEANHTLLFTASSYRDAQSYVGGLGSYF